MKKALTIAMLSAFALAAQAPAKTTAKKAAKPAPAAAKKANTAAQPIVIPKDAVETADGQYTWTDPQGKSWIFVRTPFGVMKSANSAQAVAANTPSGVKTFDEGDKVRFETQTPFGVVKHEKNKKDLTDDERSLFNRQNPSNAKQD